MADFLGERVLEPIGVEYASWDVQGGSGFLGPHTNAHTGMHISAREFARVGYLMLRGGKWQDRQPANCWYTLSAYPGFFPSLRCRTSHPHVTDVAVASPSEGGISVELRFDRASHDDRWGILARQAGARQLAGFKVDAH